MDSLRDRIADLLVGVMPSPGYGDALDEARKYADSILALFSDELDKVVDLDDLNDLHGKIGDK